MLKDHALFETPVGQPESLAYTVSQFAGRRILVVGDLILDEYLVGEVRRISPEAPVPVVELTHRAHVPGGAANVAANIAALGGKPILLGVVGDDGNAGHLEKALKSHNIEIGSLIKAAGRPTSTKTRIVSGHQQIVRLDREAKCAISALLVEKALTAFSMALDDADACVLSDYAKGFLTPFVCQQMIARATRQGKIVVVDPKGNDFTRYAGCAVVTPNLREVEISTNLSILNDADLVIAADRLLEILGSECTLLITRGADGMTLFRKGRSAIHTPALAQEVFDVTGAGDTVASTLTLALACGAALDEAMQLSNIAASIAVQKTGTATVSVQELTKALSSSTNEAPVQPPRQAAPARSYRSVANQTRLM